jgi:hypothetical protein
MSLALEPPAQFDGGSRLAQRLLREKERAGGDYMLADARHRHRHFRFALRGAPYMLVALLLTGSLGVGCMAETSELETRELEWLHAPGDAERELAAPYEAEGVAREDVHPGEGEADDEALRLELAQLLGARLEATQPATDAGRTKEPLDDSVVSESAIEVDSSLEALRRLLDGGAPLR